MEWSLRNGYPTIIGTSDGQTTVSCPAADALPHVRTLLARADWRFVGHNSIRSERPILERFGIHTALESWQDTILWHWLTGAHLCKAGGKATGDSAENQRRGPGFMNIWTMCSIHTDERCWKFCQSPYCYDVPCPEHDVFWYNGLDARNPVKALPAMVRRAKLLGVDHLYPLHARLMEQFEIMQQRGVWVDRTYIAKLRADFIEQKEQLGEQLGTSFNPDSWQQVKKFFDGKYKLKLPDTQEDTIREYAADHPEIAELQDLLAYKEMGEGADRWFAEKRWSGKDWEGYIVDQGGGLGTIHPNINCFTSTGRTACSNPNMQNIEKRRIDRRTGERIGERVRQAIVAPPGYRLYSADFSNAENRAFLYLAGYRDLPEDLHEWMVGNMGIKAEDEFAIGLGGPREASKSVTHAQDYLEGLQLKTERQIRSPRIQQEIRAGARLVFSDWRFQGFVVTFTGANLARRAFGDASYTNRKKALEAGERYLGAAGAFPKVRGLQRTVTAQVERTGMVKVPEGYCLLSYDRSPEDRLKTAASMWGQNPVAHRLKLALLNAEQHPHLIPALPVHDEILFYVDVRHEPHDVKKWVQECMEVDSPQLPLRIPTKIKVGGDWRNMVKVE